MLRSVARLLPGCLRVQVQAIRAFSDVRLEIDNPKVLKKFVGVEDHLGVPINPKEELHSALEQLLAAVQVFPPEAGYRQAVEATANYRLKVVRENESPQAIEEVLDSHIEELILEAQEETKLMPLMSSSKPWNVTQDYTVPVFDYHDAAEYLSKK